jgi:cytochrome P450
MTKTARLSTETITPAKLASAIKSFTAARELLRSPDVLQSGAGVAESVALDEDQMTLFHLDGPLHRKRRAAVAPFFTLRAIKTRYEPIMQANADRIVSELSAQKTIRLDKLAFQYAVAVAAEVLGMDHSDLPALTARIEGTINTDPTSNRPVKAQSDEASRRFFEIDVLPAIEARREQRRDDLISRMLDDGASDDLIHTEVRSYAFAGMVTTRELIVMCTWYMLENPDLRAQFCQSGTQVQLAIIDEILRLEPIVGYIRRYTAADIDLPGHGPVEAGTSLTIDVRHANTDEAATGPCPHMIDPHRASNRSPGSGYMSFGDGPHRCPGAQLALAEARAFLERLLRVPGLRLVGEPKMAWFKPIASYVFLEAVLACE